MNCPPSRHPAFLAVACLALAGAWSTGAFEADLAEREPAAVDRVALLRDSPDCLDAGGPRRALCLYQSTLGSPASSATLPAGSTDAVSPAAALAQRRTAAAERPAPARLQERSVIGTRAIHATAAR